MKKITRISFVLLFLTLSLFISGCGFEKFKTENAFDTLIESINFSYVIEDIDLPTKIGDVSLMYFSSNINILTHDGKITQTDANQTVYLFVTLKYNDYEYNQEIEVIVIKEIFEFSEPFMPKDMIYLQDALIKEEITTALLPEGEAKALIIPIDFVGNRFNTNQLFRLQRAFFGPEMETGWESVSSYYKKASYNKLNFTGTITDVFKSDRTASYYTNLYNSGEDADYMLIKDALDFLDPKIDFSDYDLDEDGYIDALYFIYSTPVYYGEPNFFNRNDSDLWWAYVSQYFTDDYEYYDGVEANYYLWAGYEFVDEAFMSNGFTDKFININASTYIHETGHMLGLEDYYDYNEDIGPDGGLGGADMMDFTVGDHSSFSKIILGWTTPYVASSFDYEIKIRPFESSGDVILVTNKWNNTYFDEYFLIDYYTPTGLNKSHSGYNGLFTKSGIRIYHVNSSIDPHKGSQKNENGYFSVFSYNNSDTKNRLISLIEADGNSSIERTLVADNKDLFQEGQVFGATVHKNYKLHNNSEINFTVNIVSITPREATIRIIFN